MWLGRRTGAADLMLLFLRILAVVVIGALMFALRRYMTRP
jgi:hypothetical protein